MAGRPKCDLRLLLEDQLEKHPPKIARELAYAKYILEYCKDNPHMTLDEADDCRARIRNHIRVIQHKIMCQRGGL